MQIFEPDKFETEILDSINDILDIRTYSTRNSTLSEMSYKQRCFLNGVIRQVKPKKILEVGVAGGGSSAIILNAIKDIDGSFLYSIDYNEKYYRDSSRNSGFIVNEKFPELSNKWKLYLGGLSAKYMEEIGGDIDLCLLDTVHSNPGEFLDILFILPYLNKNAILILHDIAYHYYFSEKSYTNGILFSSLKGKKIMLNEDYFGTEVGNIGLIILDDDIMERIFDYFYLLALPWIYMISKEDIVVAEQFIRKHYGENYAKMFLNIALHYKEKINNTKINDLTTKASNSEKQIKDISSKLNNIEKQIKDMTSKENNIEKQIKDMTSKENNIEKQIKDMTSKENNIEKQIKSINSNINNTDKKINNVINSLAWWIPNRKKREKFRNDMNNTK